MVSPNFLYYIYICCIFVPLLSIFIYVILGNIQQSIVGGGSSGGTRGRGQGVKTKGKSPMQILDEEEFVDVDADTSLSEDSFDEAMRTPTRSDDGDDA